MAETQIDKLRRDLIRLRGERDKIIFEKGMAAEENKDLRENSAYDYWFEKEMHITSRINNIVASISELSRKPTPKSIFNPKNHGKTKEKYELERPKWL